MKRFIEWLLWTLKGRPGFTVPGFYCTDCGDWIDQKFQLRQHDIYTGWGLCAECSGVGG